MDCQTTCQEESFEQCEYELRIDCDGACSGDGAIFCDGEYVLGGRQIPACARALIERGLADIDLEASGSFEVDGDSLSAASSGKGRASCSAVPGVRAGSAWPLAALLLGALFRRRRARKKR
jgi:uncharacterized protein (TIGR03382 family)